MKPKSIIYLLENKRAAFADLVESIASKTEMNMCRELAIERDRLLINEMKAEIETITEDIKILEKQLNPPQS